MHHFGELSPCVGRAGQGCPSGGSTGPGGLWSGYFDRVEDQLVMAVERDSAAASNLNTEMKGGGLVGLKPTDNW